MSCSQCKLLQEAHTTEINHLKSLVIKMQVELDRLTQERNQLFINKLFKPKLEPIQSRSLQ